jgi:hypothetical protein
MTNSYKYNGELISPKSTLRPNIRPYPWTQLGYTYGWGNLSDWGDPNRPKGVGLSEFVILRWSPISVKSVQTAADYCRGQ